MGECLGCEQQQMIKERSFELIKEQAEKYAKENRISLAIYMEGGEWKYISAEIAHRLSIPYRDLVLFDK